MKPDFGPYYRVSGTTSIYNPVISKTSQISMSHIWVENGYENKVNKISAGWHVSYYSYIFYFPTKLSSFHLCLNLFLIIYIHMLCLKAKKKKRKIYLL